eukprot:TRINITY_DN70447_c0_g1_i1.p1 TRINITY_DN70447_c0_g1~~TRINITY_DN70447_c0_g1_i1.p1  ORF type:complete len:358 (+),score=51.60 TRINITY_DN70447_c0_g1_i1:36-1076(+)
MLRTQPPPLLAQTPGSPSHLMVGKRSPKTRFVVDDDLAFIEQLLDTLQADSTSSTAEQRTEEPGRGADNAEDTHGHGPGELADGRDLGASLGGLYEVQDPLEHVSVPELCASADRESWTSLIGRFCEDGDESIVDRLLENFLSSGSDAANLIDAISKKGLTASVERKEPLPDFRGQLHLKNLEQLRSIEDPLEALLSSARLVLQSARTSQSPHSRSSANSSWAPSPCAAQGPSEQSAVAVASAAPCMGVAMGDASHSPTRAEMLARLAASDDPDAMRNFLRNFLLGVRHRCLNEVEGMPAVGEVDSESEGANGSRSGYASSVWTCRSVNTEVSHQTAATSDFVSDC